MTEKGEKTELGLEATALFDAKRECDSLERLQGRGREWVSRPDFP
jgi:hypothetical protein